ncbi:hypothetical protein C8Q79DRAFT_1006460 [Trametes meyenii]|nr:hypothetical protein C8Q79DRAFT_1006460 [Trametes meyenii]
MPVPPSTASPGQHTDDHLTLSAASRPHPWPAAGDAPVDPARPRPPPLTPSPSPSSRPQSQSTHARPMTSDVHPPAPPHTHHPAKDGNIPLSLDVSSCSLNLSHEFEPSNAKSASSSAHLPFSPRTPFPSQPPSPYSSPLTAAIGVLSPPPSSAPSTRPTRPRAAQPLPPP